MDSSDHLFATLYNELHRLADSHLKRSGRDLTLSPTTLIHEAWLDLSSRRALDFPDRARFLAYAARAMRGIVIDYARQSRAQKRGGDAFQITLHPDLANPQAQDATELSRLSEALDDLSRLEPELAELVDLHFFCGYSFGEIAELRSVSERTVQRGWRKARLLLHHALLHQAAPSSAPNASPSSPSPEAPPLPPGVPAPRTG
jgi:RNA polymerase sigma factor (TIGR02999 family)